MNWRWKKPDRVFIRWVGLLPFVVWSGNVWSIDTLTVGYNGGNRATEDIYAAGHISGTVAHVNESDFNSMSLSDMLEWDVILIQWISSSSLNVNWSRMSPYVAAGGGFIFDGDPNNAGDLAPLVSAYSGGGYTWDLVASVPGLTDGITADFVNCHVVFSAWDTSVLSPFLTDGGGTTMGLYGTYGSGRMVLTGPDQDYHASAGGPGAADNQYNFLINEINWVSAGCDPMVLHPDDDGDGYGNPDASIEACEATAGFVEDGTDCDDTHASVNPGMVEIPYDGLDNDCSGGDITDVDGDGYDWVGVPGGLDCDDLDPRINPDGTEVPYDGVDDDCDGTDLRDVDDDGYDWVGVGGDDCVDSDPTISPDAIEVEDGIDADCDGLVDEDTDAYDDDGDGYSEHGGDCDDADDGVHPGAEETWDSVDEDCDGVIDEGTSGYDDDGDGYTEAEGDCSDGDEDVSPGLVEIPGDGIDNDCDGVVDDGSHDTDGDGYSTSGGDCDDLDASAHPGATEEADGIDNDCDGVVDEGTSGVDNDGDGLSADDGDCDDTDATIGPDAEEVVDGVDNDCDGDVDEDSVYTDDDGDGFSEYAGDCDDDDESIHPGAEEDPDNGIDDDCDGDTDEIAGDADGDGYTEASGDCDDTDGWANPGLEEMCDGLDNDCDGEIDEGCGDEHSGSVAGDGSKGGGCSTAPGPMGLAPWALALLGCAVRRREDRA